MIEKDIVLKIANYLKQYLSEYYNVKVILTHDGVNVPEVNTLAVRAMIARNNNADLYVSLHINDISNKSVNGANVFVTSRTELYKYKEGMTVLGNKILKNLNSLGIKNNGVVNNKLCSNTDNDPKYKYYDGKNADYYGDIRFAMKGDTSGLGANLSDGSGISTVLIEHCYINNSHDSQFLDSNEDLKKLAKADADAIADYYNLILKKDVVTDIKIDKYTIDLIKGEKHKIKATLQPTTATNNGIKWTSSNEKIAKVDSSGNVTAVGVGTTKIKATSVDNPNVSKTININVEDYSIKFEKKEDNILIGKTKILDVTTTPSWIENAQIVWDSDNKDIVEITETGQIFAKNEGTATIKATWKGKNLTDTIKINVIKLSDDITINIKQYKVQNYKISKIGEKIKIDNFLKNIIISDNLEIKLETVNKNQEYIGTNTKIIIKDKKSNLEIEEYECLIYGDINGDGKISAMDYTLIKNHIMDVKKITNNNMKLTADINGDNKISAMDYTLIKNHIMDIKKISAK